MRGCLYAPPSLDIAVLLLLFAALESRLQTTMEITQIGARYHPPTLYIFYTDNEHQRRRKMPVRSLFNLKSTTETRPSVDLTKIVREISKRHFEFLMLVPVHQLRDVLRRIMTNLNINEIDGPQPDLTLAPISRGIQDSQASNETISSDYCGIV